MRKRSKLKENSRVLEMDWLEQHHAELSVYRGEWIAVDGSQLVAHAIDLVSLLRLATEAGHPDPLITAVPEEDYDGIYLGA